MRDDIKESIDRYAKDGIPCGDFLTSVLSNDLFQALGRADDDNRRDIFEICQYIYNEIPGSCWGTPLQVHEWLKKKRAERIVNQPEEKSNE